MIMDAFALTTVMAPFIRKVAASGVARRALSQPCPVFM
jgi:hypothetical protein